MANQQVEQQGLKAYMLQLLAMHKLYILALIVVAIFAGVFEISVDYKIKEIIDIIAQDHNSNLNYLLALFVFYKLMYHGMYFACRLLDIKYHPIILAQTITDIYNNTVKHSLHWFDSHLSGEISNKIVDFESSIGTLISSLFRTFNVVATIIITVTVLVQVNLFSALVLLAFILIYTPIIYCLWQKQMCLQESFAKSKQETVGIINDSIVNIFGVKVIGDLLTEFKLKLRPAISNWQAWDKKARQFDAYYVDNADTLMTVIMSAVQIYLLAHLYQQGTITAGGFAFIAMMTLKIHYQLNNFLENLLFNISPSIAQIRSSYSFVSSVIDVADHAEPEKLTAVKGAIGHQIEYQNVCFSYDNSNKSILNKFNLTIKTGERIGVVGSSGAGKTTMMKCLLRYFDVADGAILIDGHNIQDISQESLRKAMSIIPQDITMFHRSIKDNLKLAAYDATDAEIISACKKAKIHDDVEAMPAGYDTVVGERGIKLSGGQRQRIAIARAILKNAPILILDEATSSLDTPTEKLIQDSINDVLENSKATVIAIAHRLSTLKHMDRILVLEKGNVVEVGSHIELLKKKDGLYKKLWEMQAI